MLLLLSDYQKLADRGWHILPKDVIDADHSNTRSSSIGVRNQIAHLDTCMKDVAEGDVSKLCAHTRNLLYELNAAGESTMGLITNLIITFGYRGKKSSNVITLYAFQAII